MVETSTGARVRQARMRSALSQAQLAQLTGVAEATINRIELGRNTQPRFVTVHKLAEALQVNPGWLLTGEGERDARPA